MKKTRLTQFEKMEQKRRVLNLTTPEFVVFRNVQSIEARKGKKLIKYVYQDANTNIVKELFEINKGKITKVNFRVGGYETKKINPEFKNVL